MTSSWAYSSGNQADLEGKTDNKKEIFFKLYSVFTAKEFSCDKVAP